MWNRTLVAMLKVSWVLKLKLISSGQRKWLLWHCTPLMPLPRLHPHNLQEFPTWGWQNYCSLPCSSLSDFVLHSSILHFCSNPRPLWEQFSEACSYLHLQCTCFFLFSPSPKKILLYLFSAHCKQAGAGVDLYPYSVKFITQCIVSYRWMSELIPLESIVFELIVTVLSMVFDSINRGYHLMMQPLSDQHKLVNPSLSFFT